MDSAANSQLCQIRELIKTASTIVTGSDKHSIDNFTLSQHIIRIRLVAKLA